MASRKETDAIMEKVIQQYVHEAFILVLFNDACGIIQHIEEIHHIQEGPSYFTSYFLYHIDQT